MHSKPFARNDLTLRPARESDAMLLFGWANEADSLAGKLRTTGPITWPEHRAWFETRLSDAKGGLWIAECDVGPVGQVRLQLAGDAFEIDIFVVRPARGEGVAKRMLERAAEIAGSRWSDIPLIARVLPDNSASKRLFASAGYEVDGEAESHVRMRLVTGTKAVANDPGNGPGSNFPARQNTNFKGSDAMYRRAEATNPLASQTFSKSAMQFVKGAAPLFLDHGKGCRVWDIDGNEYLDYMMGLLPVVLGYCDPHVDQAIQLQLGKGITFSLATTLEAELAEVLVDLIPCAEMVRFGKNGSDATTAAVRLARAHAGRDRIACCGYHGWHDWYIGTTSRDIGVPSGIRGLTHQFPYNDADALKKLLGDRPDEFAAVIMEPMQFEEPSPGYLETVRELTDKHGVVLIFDEIVTGFRIDIGGAQAHFGVTPDLACFGKSMGNGMPISAVVGQANIMRGMEDIFFSGTFGGETLSLAATLATIDKLQRENAVFQMKQYGAKWTDGMANLLTRHGLDGDFAVNGAPWWPRLQVIGGGELPANLITSLLRQEAIANGILQLSSCNLSYAHVSEDVLEETLARWDRTFAMTADHLRSNDAPARLRGQPVRPVFQVRQGA
jgi:glutamate-1-semialdehyde aminotransferase/RimJ/RimL family protein N-acetyltransferase